MNIEVIVNKINNKESKLVDFVNELGIGRRTLQRKIKESGYKYNQKLKIYEKVVEGKTVVLNEDKIKYKRKTYDIPSDIVKALGYKSNAEDRSVSDIIRDILRDNIEDKYFNVNL